MVSVQRAFAQKLSSQHAADVRRQISSNTAREITKCDRSIQLSLSPYDTVEPLDYEEFIQQHQLLIDRDPLRYILDFPPNDIEVCVLTRKVRTQVPIVPKEPLNELSPIVRDCVDCYTRDWVFVDYRYRHHSSTQSLKENKEIFLHNIGPHQEYEVDLDRTDYSETSSEDDGFKIKCGSSQSSTCDVPRGSWASFDLLNCVSDPLMPPLLERIPPDTIDQINQAKRQQDRQDGLFLLYPQSETDEIIERRFVPDPPTEHSAHRILVKCLQLKLELEVEPIFASVALYDAKEKKKISENFYFDLNSESLRRMLQPHVPYSDVSTMCRACVFNITYPSSDLFIVIKLEKVLQGDINECAEPYIKDEKNVDKVKVNAQLSCERLGKYRMPFAWTAVSLMNVVTGMNSLDRDRDSGSDKEIAVNSSNSLDRKLSTSNFENLRKRASDMGSLTRRGSLERRASSDKRFSWSSEDFTTSLDTFRPVTLTVSSFFKQESDKLRDEDLYKFLQDLKRPCSVLKKLKCIPGSLKLDISPLTEDIKNCLTPELAPLLPVSDEKGRPTKEILEFPAKEILAPHYHYRNLLYVYPKELNFAGRTGSARNIAVKVQLMSGEEELDALPVIFGKSSCPEFCSQVYTTVSYHNKCPSFYDEVKIQIPANLSDQHHLLFTFYHISCQRKAEQNVVETPVGYTWLPIFRDGHLGRGEYCLPVMLEHPPPNYSYIGPEVMLPGTKWVDNHKGIFTVFLEPISSVHTQDKYLENFLNLCASLEQGIVPQRMTESNIENELKVSLLNLSNAKTESLVKFLPLILDKLIGFLVKPLSIPINISQTIFQALAQLVRNIAALQEGFSDLPGRHVLLTTYITYQCTLPHPICSDDKLQSHLRSSSNPDSINVLGLQSDSEISSYSRGLDRACSMKTGACSESYLFKTSCCKLVHEELALQWVVASGTARELSMANAWFFFDLMVKSMLEHLERTQSLDIPRKLRFSEHFTDDVSTLVTTFTSDIIANYNKDPKLSNCMNSSLAFFLYDLLSIMDRGFVFILIKVYCKQMSAKISSLPDGAILYNYKLDLLRIICSHEHFVALNLAFGTPFTWSSAPASPTPSQASSTSQARDKASYAELSTDFRQQHFLIGLVLTDLAVVLDMQNMNLHMKAVNLIKNLMAAVDNDQRFGEPEAKARVAALYLPILVIIMDMLPQLYTWHRGRSFQSINEEFEPQTGINQSVAMAIAGTSMFGVKTAQVERFSLFQQARKTGLSAETTRNLLICFLWVIKNMDKEVLRQWWLDLPSQRLRQLLEALDICISCFEYKGKRTVKNQTQQFSNKTMDIKSRLEDVILGQGSARCEMMLRRKGVSSSGSISSTGTSGSSINSIGMSVTGSGDRLRWRKEQMAYRSPDVTDRPRPNVKNVEMEGHVEGSLATEVSFIVLDTLEQIVQVSSQSDHLQGLLGAVLRVLLHALSRNQSTCVLHNMFATQRSVVFKFPNLLFDEETEQCADLCLQLLKHCSSYLTSVRSQASASLYLLMRQNFEIGNNFARVKMQVTMSLSSLVGTSQTFCEASLRRSLKTILLYSEEDHDLQDTTFPEQVKDLVFNLHMILSDTVKMKEFQEDPEMLLDLMYRIAKGYQNSPDLRLTWLANMAQKHLERNNQTEAGMCLVHSAALVAEYLHMLEDQKHLPLGAVSLECITPNCLEECAVSEDVLSPEEEGVCLGKDFTESGLIGLLEHAANCFHTAGMYEAMNSVYKVMIPITEATRDYKKLANIHGKLHDAFTRMEQLQGKRVFGTYFRVGFYGIRFGDLNGEEFIYKEPTLTKLPEIFSRLENFYAERFGPDNLVIIKDSNVVDSNSLDPDKAYIQITYVEPYFEPYEARYRATHFDRNFNIKRFLYATPFTTGGRAHGELHEQHKRKTILTAANHFPYVKTRIQVVHRKQIVLTPIEVAIEDIQKKTLELAHATQQDPPDPKILQMVLQGCIGTTVNQGPMEVAVVFLSDLVDGVQPPTKFQNKLRLCFKDFSKKCSDALRKNKNLIGPDQRDYQRELERNYHRFSDRLMPLITVKLADRRKV
ncbi:dedicator of cytokinesis [Lycorma delicatula]|uniref:dedicator of cytokinesis n=1 Tax=Lycorma delicatula TaxID=130591 RepID=UPI003F510347